jgi:hypothetical protein
MRITGHKDLGLLNGVYVTQWFVEDGEHRQTFTTEVSESEVADKGMEYRYLVDRMEMGSRGIAPKVFDDYAMGRQEPPNVQRSAATQWDPLGG